MNEHILLSVEMITYKHEAYIKQAIEGVLMQETNFEFELIIADDCSPDNTENVVRDIIVNHPKGHLIKYFRHEKNVGMHTNAIFAVENCNGKYIALCEGDDYWTDPLKLQRQIDYLEQNSECSMCFHTVMIENCFTNTIFPEKAVEDRFYSIDEFIMSKVAHTVSFVFRKSFLQPHLLLQKNIFGGDVILALMMAENGRVYGMHQNMAVYRIHEGGITSIDSKKLGVDHQKRFVKQYIFIRKTFKSLSKKSTSIKIVDHCSSIVQHYYRKRNLKGVKYIIIGVYYRPELIFKGLKKILK